MPELFVVTGAGPVGWTVAEQLAAQGKRVRVLTRSGSGPEHPLIERMSVDVAHPALLDGAFAGAAAVFHCIHGSAYAEDAWQRELPRAEEAVLAAAGEAGAAVVFPESLYSYSRPGTVMAEDSPREAQGGKRGVRTALLKARAASPANTVSVVAGDFFGPRVRNSHAGERIVPAVLAGKRLLVIGSADQPHSFTYVPDLAAAMIRAAQTPALWNRVWHAPTGPAVTQRRLAAAFAEAGGVPAPKMGAVPSGPSDCSPAAPASWPRCCTSSSGRSSWIRTSARAALGLHPTPLPEAAAATVAWWRAQG